MESHDHKISLNHLFLKFLKIGSTSFGGFMALISMVEKQFVDRYNLVKSEELLDTISVASMLPGPMAVNVVAYVGYKLRGIKGALISMFAVLLPTFILIVILSHFYFKYGNIPQVDSAFNGIVPAVCGIILSVALSMGKKNLKDWKMLTICLAAALLYIFVGGFFVTLIIILSAGIIGWMIYNKNIGVTKKNDLKIYENAWSIISYNRKFLITVIITALVIFFIPDIFSSHQTVFHQLRKLALTFGTVSVTLFGGGYVFIPMLQELIVENMEWLTIREFIDGIALGQITPGPIMISAAFVGYKIAGLSGAIISTLAMFLPPAMIMIIVSSFIDDLKNSAFLIAAFKGIRSAVIGMIFAAAWVIGKSFALELIPLSIIILVFILSYFFKWNVVYLIPAAGLLGLILL